jgi:Putative Actinobacterial Holin-X, holin superfamily III
VIPDHDNPEDESTTGLLGDVVFGITQLVKGEIALVRAEVQHNMRDAARAIVKLTVAGIVGIVALNLLAAAAVGALVAAGLSPMWASFAVGIVLMLAAFVTVKLALPLLASSNLAPKRSFANMRKDADILKSMVTPHATSDLRPGNAAPDRSPA